jgi:hypothetical protein
MTTLRHERPFAYHASGEDCSRHGTRARGLGATVNRTRPQNIVVWPHLSVGSGEGLEPPTLVLFSDPSPGNR